MPLIKQSSAGCLFFLLAALSIPTTIIVLKASAAISRALKVPESEQELQNNAYGSQVNGYSSSQSIDGTRTERMEENWGAGSSAGSETEKQASESTSEQTDCGKSSSGRDSSSLTPVCSLACSRVSPQVARSREFSPAISLSDKEGPLSPVSLTGSVDMLYTDEASWNTVMQNKLRDVENHIFEQNSAPCFPKEVVRKAHGGVYTRQFMSYESQCSDGLKNILRSSDRGSLAVFHVPGRTGQMDKLCLPFKLSNGKVSDFVSVFRIPPVGPKCAKFRLVEIFQPVGQEHYKRVSVVNSSDVLVIFQDGETLSPFLTMSNEVH